MWKPEDRLAADGIGLRYLSDLTDGKWAIIEPMVPLATHGGRRGHDPWLQEQSCLGVILAYLRKRPGSPINLCNERTTSSCRTASPVSPKAKVLNRDRARFEVAGGNYRLIASFDFRRQIVFVKFIGTHAEYDAIDPLTVARF